MGILLLAAARGRRHHHLRRRPRRGRRAAVAGRARARPGSARTRGAPDRYPASRPASSSVGPSCSPRHADVVRFPIPPDRVEHELAPLDRARARSHAQLAGDPRPAGRSGPGHDLAPLFDAQLLMLDDSMFMGRAAGHRARTSGSTPPGRCTGRTRSCARSSPRVEDPYLRERDSDLADVAGRLRMNLRRGRRLGAPTCCATSTGRPSSSPTSSPPRWPRSSTGRGSSASRPTPAAARITPPSSRVRSRCRRSSACAIVSRRVSPGTAVVLDGTTGDRHHRPVVRRHRRRAPARDGPAASVSAARRGGRCRRRP